MIDMTRSDIKDAVRTKRTTLIFTWAARALGVLIILAGIFVIVTGALANGTMRAQISTLQGENSALREDLQASQENAERLYEQLLELDVKPEGEDPEDLPTTPPSSVPGEQGERGEQGPGPTAAQIADAVTLFCAEDRCVGPTGPAGAEGPAGATGNTGSPGAAGEPGSDGPPGPQGAPGPTCPSGYGVSYVWLSVADSQFGVFSRQPAAICRPL